MAKNFFVHYNGCIRRGLDSSRIEDFFLQNGWVAASRPKDADKIIFVTCSFKETQKKSSLDLIRKFEKMRGELIVAGCLPDIAPEEFKKGFKGRFVSTRNLNDFGAFFNDFEKDFKTIPDSNAKRNRSNLNERSLPLLVRKFFLRFGSLNRLFYGVMAFIPKKYSILRSSWGCVQQCSYCGIFRAVGPLKSKPLEVCLQEYKRLLDSGKRHFVLVAENVGAYGLDIGLTFVDLLKAMSKVDEGKEVNWEVQDLHPVWAIKYTDILVGLIKAGKITKIHIPIQSGSERILKLMNRYSDVEKMEDAMLKIRSANKKLDFITHLLAGFPTETEEDFKKSIDFIKKCKVNNVSIYLYFAVPDTPAFRMGGQVSLDVVKRRVAAAGKELDKAGIYWTFEELAL